MQRALADPKMLMGGATLIVLTGLMVWGVLSSPMREQKEAADDPLLLKPGDKGAWEKTQEASGLAAAESGAGARKLPVRSLTPPRFSAARASAAAPASKPVSKAELDALQKTMDAAAGEDVDSTSLVQNTDRGSWEEARAGEMSRIDALDNRNWAGGGQGGAIRGEQGGAERSAPTGHQAMQAGGRTIQTSAGRPASREAMGTLAAKGASSGAGRGQRGTSPQLARSAASAPGDGGWGGASAGAASGGGAPESDGGLGGSPAGGAGRPGSTSGMMNLGGAGGGGGLAGGGGGQDPESEQPVQRKTRAEVEKEVAALKSLANDYYENVVRRTSQLEMERLPTLKTRTDSAYGTLSSLKRKLETAKRSYSGEALQAVADTLNLVENEQLPRLTSASQGIEQSAVSMGNLLSGCDVAYTATRYREAYNWEGATYSEPYEEWVNWPPRGALTAHDRADRALTDAQHVRELCLHFSPIVADEYERIAKTLERTDRDRAASLRALSSDIRGAFSSVTSALPEGLLVGGNMGLTDLHKAALAGHNSIRSEERTIKAENLAYVQCPELDAVRDRMTMASDSAGDASGSLSSASGSMVALVRGGKNAVEAYIDVCEAKNSMEGVAAKTP